MMSAPTSTTSNVKKAPMKSKNHFLLAASAIMIGSAHPAAAKDTPESLKITVEAVSAEGQLCGLSKPAHIASLQAALKANGIAENREDFANPVLWLQTQTLIVNRTCFTSISLQIQQYTGMEVEGMGRLYGTIAFCGNHAVLGGSDMPARVDAQIQRMFGKCVAEMTTMKMD